MPRDFLPWLPQSVLDATSNNDFASTVQNALGSIQQAGSQLMQPIGQQIQSLMPAPALAPQPQPEPVVQPLANVGQRLEDSSPNNTLAASPYSLGSLEDWGFGGSPTPAPRPQDITPESGSFQLPSVSSFLPSFGGQAQEPAAIGRRRPTLGRSPGSQAQQPTGKPSEFNAYVRQASAQRGLDPDQVLKVVGKEGPTGWGSVGAFNTGTSYGPLQLHYAGGSTPTRGMGDDFTRDTGLDLRQVDPSTPEGVAAHQRAVDYALDRLSKTGDYREWYGADPALGSRMTKVNRVTPSMPTSLGEVPQALGAAGRAAGQAVGRAVTGEQAGGLNTSAITQAYKGVPYTFGGAGGRGQGLGATTDCSGFVAAVWKDQYGLDLPAHTDASYTSLQKLGATEVAQKDARPGDIVYYMGAGTGGNISHHMGIFAGDGKVLDMSTSGGSGVKTRDIGHGGTFVILRDPRVNAAQPATATAPQPIVPTGVAERTGGDPLPQAQVDALSNAPWDRMTRMQRPADRQHEADPRMAMMSGAGSDFGPMASTPMASTPMAVDRYSSSYNDPDAGGTISAPLPSPAPSAWDTIQQGATNLYNRAAAPQTGVGEAVRGAAAEAQRVGGNVLGTLGDAGSAAWQAAEPTLSGPKVAQPTWEDPLAPVRGVAEHIRSDPTSVLPARIYGDIQGAGANVIGRQAGVTLGASEDPTMRIPESVPLIGGTPFSEADAAGKVGEVLLDPLNFVGVPAGIKSGQSVAGAVARAVPGVGEAEALLRGGAGLVRRAVDAIPTPSLGQQADEGVQVLGGGFVPSGPNLEARIASARARLDAAAEALRAPDEALGEAAARGSDADLRQAQRAYGPARRAYDEAANALTALTDQQRQVSGRIDAAGYGEPIVDAGLGAERSNTRVRGPVSPFRDDAPREISLGSGLIPSGLRADAYNAAQGGVVGAASEVSQAEAEGRETDLGEMARRGLLGMGLGAAAGRGVGSRQSGGVGSGAAVTRASSNISPLGRRLMDTYTAVTPARAEASTATAIETTASSIQQRMDAAAAAGKPLKGPGMTQAPAEFIAAVHDAIVQNLKDTKIVATGIRGDALQAYLRGEGLTSKVDTRDLGTINRITQKQVNVGGGRAGRPYTVADAANFAQRESEQFRAAAGGSRMPDPETGAIDEEAPRIMYAYVSEGQPLVGPNRPTVWLVWDDDTPRITSAHHPYGLLSDQDIHANMEPGIKAATQRPGAVAGGRWTPAALDQGGNLVEAAPGVPGAEPLLKDWETRGLEVGGHGPSGDPRKIMDTTWLVGPEGEDAMRANGLVLGMNKGIQDAIASGRMADPEGVAAALMRGGAPKWKGGWGAVMNPSRSESLVVDPDISHIKAIYISGVPKDLLTPLEGGGRKGARITEKAFAQKLRADVFAATGSKDIPIYFNDITKAAPSAAAQKAGATMEGWAPTRMPDAQLLEGPDVPLSPGRGRVVERYTQETDPATGRTYTNLGSGVVAEAPASTGQPDDIVQLGGGFVPFQRPPGAPAPGAPAPGAPAQGFLASLPGGTRAAARWQQATQNAATQAAAAQAAGKAPPPTAGDWLRSIGYSAMIGPSTGIVNAVGNGMELAYHVPKDIGRALVRGRPGEAAVEGRGIVTGFMRAGGEILDALAGAHPGGGVETARLSQRATGRFGQMAAGLLEAPTRLFSEVPDAFYRSIAESMGEARAAAQHASDAGLTGQQWKQHVADLLEDAKQVRAGQLPTRSETQRVLDDGAKLAERLTLRGDIGPRGQQFKAGMDALPFGLGHLVMPFFNTPYQMSQRLLERTPAGLKMGTQPGRYDKVYDALVGSSIGAGAAGLALGGLISGSGPDDPDERKLRQSQGWQNNSTLVGGVWVPNNAFGVFGPMLDAAGELGDAMRYQKKDATGRDLGGDLVRRAGEVAKNQVYLKGVADLLKALEKPAQFGEAFAASTISRTIPLGATARTLATAEDTLERRPEPGGEVGFLENVQQRVARGLPSVTAPLPGISSRQELPVDQDVLGRPVENPRSGMATFGPRTRTPRPDPILERFEAAGVTIGPPRAELTEDGQKVDLTPAETRRWNELRGERIIAATERLIESGALDRMPPERRAERLEEIKTDAADRATMAVRREMGPGEYRRRRTPAA